MPEFWSGAFTNLLSSEYLRIAPISWRTNADFRLRRDTVYSVALVKQIKHAAIRLEMLL